MRKVVIRNGKKYLVTIPNTDPFCDGGGYYGGGSLVFGDRNQFVTASASATDFVLSTGSFTVEWFQYATDTPINSRIFTLGVWPTAEFGVSIENYQSAIRFFPWIDGGGNIPAIAHSASVTLPYTGSWNHFVLVRESGSYLQILQNGNVLRTFVGADAFVTANISSSLPIIVGSEGDNAGNTRFSGSITSFRLVKGTALYSGSYTVPTSPLTAVAGTVLLLAAWDPSNPYLDTSGTGKTIAGNSVSFSLANPF